MALKTTNILRRIDDLGRVVIPKEIRKQMGIRIGDPLEIFIDPNERMVGFKTSTQDEPLAVLEDLRSNLELHGNYTYEDLRDLNAHLDSVKRILKKY